jgi:hypothetical protein
VQPVACGDGFEPLYVLAITTGRWRGEPLRLRCDDADLKRGTLRVGTGANPGPLLLYSYSDWRVDPTRLELVTSAMRGRRSPN